MDPVRTDPITLSVLWGGLVAAAEEAANTLQHTAYSEAVREGRDFSAGVFDRHGRLLAQADLSPGHLGSMPFAVQNMLRFYPVEDLTPGDFILMNDLYMGSGHLLDYFGMTPVFVDETLIGFSVACCHLIDTGGSAPGGQTVEGIVDYFQEGLRLLPVRLFTGGHANGELLRVIEANVRIPQKVLGDLRAQRLGCMEGARRFGELVRRHGVEVFETCCNELLDNSEAAVRDAIRAIPQGRYEFADYVDDYGRGTPPIRIAVAVDVRDGDITLDFTGTDPQTVSGLNCPINYTRSYCYWAVKAVTTQHHIPQNEGQVRPVHLIAPEGSFVNPRPPAGAGARAVLNTRIVEVILGALASALPGTVTSANSHFANPTIGGEDPQSGSPFVFYDLFVGGLGAHSAGDGTEAIGPVFGFEALPIEVIEASYPVRIERMEMMPDSGGAGRYRGGCGIRRDIRVFASKARLNNLTERQRFAPWGLFGGLSGKVGRTLLNPGADEEVLHAKGSYELKAGDLLRFELAGAGGYGDPFDRSEESVRRDVIEGYVTLESARSVYGVVLDPATLELDSRATESARGRRDFQPSSLR